VRGHKFNFELDIDGKVEKHRFTLITLDLYIHGDPELEKNQKEIETIVRLAKNLCVVSNSISSPFEIHLHPGKELV
jgi:uncharacterized OsmC-like protein